MNIMAKKPVFDPTKPYQILGEKAPTFDPSKPFEVIRSQNADEMSLPETAFIGLQKGVSLGFRPALAGVGSSIGQAAYEAEKGVQPNEGLSGFVSRITKGMPSAYQEGRKSALAEQEKAYRDNPKTAFASDLAGSALLMPFAPITSVKAGAGFGALQGVGQAVSEDKDAADVAKDALKGGALGVAADGAGKGIEKAYPKVKGAIKSAIDYLDDKAKTGFIKTASALTGESQKNIRTFIEKNDAVNKLVAESGGDIGVAADQIRTSLQKQIQSFRRNQNVIIGDALDNVSPEKVVPKDTVIGGLNRVREKLNPILKPEEVGQIDEMITRINTVGGDTGKVSLKELHEIQDFLYERAKGAYMKNGQIFVPGKMSQQAAKAGAREAKLILDDMVPELRAANENLSKLHKIEENINRNLIAPGKSESALLAAGSATTGRNKLYLDELGKIIGKDVTGEAEKLSAAAAFGNPQLMPKSAGGTTSTSRTLIGAAAGSILGGPAGAAVGAALTSPMALKQAINTGLISRDVLKKTLGESINFADEKVLTNLVNYLSSPSGQGLLNRAVNIKATQNKNDAVNRRMEFLDQNAN